MTIQDLGIYVSVRKAIEDVIGEEDLMMDGERKRPKSRCHAMDAHRRYLTKSGLVSKALGSPEAVCEAYLYEWASTYEQNAGNKPYIHAAVIAYLRKTGLANIIILSERIMRTLKEKYGISDD